jgi:hypothetical protein
VLQNRYAISLPAEPVCEILLAAIDFALFIYTPRQTYLGWDRNNI